MSTPSIVPGTHGQRSAAGLALVIGSLAVTLALGAALHAPCSDVDDSRPELRYRLCYSDITALWSARELDTRFPYLEARNEYPVGTGLLMGITALPASNETQYLTVNVLVLSLAALAIALLLYRLAGIRALFFTAAPALAAYSFLNWDLFALALAVGAASAFLSGRDRTAGVMTGLGTAAKIFPAFLLPGFALERVRVGDRLAAMRVALMAAMAWVALNAPIALTEPGRWRTFFRFNASRPVEPTTVWGLGCSEHMTGVCLDPRLVNAASLGLLVAAAVVVWKLRLRREPDFPRWTFAVPLMILFLLTNKVYSPQYSLWLVPWFALAMPDVMRFVVWSGVDLAAWAATLAFVRQVPGSATPPLAFVKVLVVARAVTLLWLLAGYVGRPSAPAPSTAGSE